ncbi:MAG: tRNA lysidine(34) synthetase TilS [Alphaproteobacteria bacterium]|nr:tRNA lysidine(34) synthetase TilS [Alphaproteobacteria bacterium]
MKNSRSEFETCLEDMPTPLALAVSGGSDSMALMLLAQKWAAQKGYPIVALTVDHGLRTESRSEALHVQKWAKDRGIEHVILEWAGEKPTSRLQEKAREARYNLLTSWCKENHVPTLLLGHHQQDQEETFWLRLAAGSGLEGLGGMKQKSIRNGIILLRPLLHFSKEHLQDILKVEKQTWINDPSNENPRFFRGRLRLLLKEEGLSVPRLGKVITKLQEDSDFIRSSLQEVLQTIVQIYEEGYITISKKEFEKLHPALAKRVVLFLVQWFSKGSYPPRSHQIISIFEKLKKGTAFTGGGVYWVPDSEGISLFREFSAISPRLPLKQLLGKMLWDQRFWVDPKVQSFFPHETYLAPLGSIPSLKKIITSKIPARARLSLPAFWLKGELVTVPHLCYNKLKNEEDIKKFINLKPLF